MSVEIANHSENLEKMRYIDTIKRNLNDAGLNKLASRFAVEMNDRPYLTIAKGDDQSELRTQELASQWLTDVVKIIAKERENHTLFTMPKGDVKQESGSDEDLILSSFPDECQAFKMFLIGLGGVEGMDNDKIIELLRQPIMQTNQDKFITKNPAVEVYVRFGIDNIEFELGAVD
jgi:hypothetical protein